MSRLSRVKGSRFEVEVAKKLSKWYYGNPNILRRVPLSGGWEGQRYGDVMLPPHLVGKVKPFPFYVECKHRRDLKVVHLFKPKSLLYKTFLQTCSHAVQAQKVALLVFKPQNGFPLVMTTSVTVEKLSFDFYFLCGVCITITLEELLRKPAELFLKGKNP